MLLNLQNINSNIYFEFYLKDNLFCRYNFKTDDLEISLKDFCYYLTQYIYHEYQTKKCTGFHFDTEKTLSLYMIVQNDNSVADIDPTKEVLSLFPLDLLLPDKIFVEKLYFSIILLAENLLDFESIVKEFSESILFLLQISPNIFWRNFLASSDSLKIEANFIVRSYENKLKEYINNLNHDNLELYINEISSMIYTVEENATNVLRCYEYIISEYSNYFRRLRYLSNVSIASLVDSFPDPTCINHSQFLKYFQGYFRILSPEQFQYMNRFLALSLLNQMKNNLEVAESFYLQCQTWPSHMLDIKSKTILELNKIQQQAISLWQK